MNNLKKLTISLAFLAAFIYILLAAGVMKIETLTPEEAPAGIIWAAAAGYLLGGVLILRNKRWLWITGAVINGLVMMMFFSAYAERPEVLFSTGGLITKTTQLILETGLIYLILKNRPSNVTTKQNIKGSVDPGNTHKELVYEYFDNRLTR
ncbi:MAG: hypothetical protein ACRKGH_05105 [Dehalogenimonas sp.]